MSFEQVWLLVGGAVAVALLVVVLLARRTANRSARELAAARSNAEALAQRLAAIEESLERHETARRPEVDSPSYVITHLGDEEPDAVPVAARIDGKLFADIVARESVIKVAGLAAGLRRALAPEVRNRIRFEMRREVLRARKQRRADLKAALRDFRARERADLPASEDLTDERHDEGDAA